MAKPSLDQLATYGGAVLLELPEAETVADSPVRDGAIALFRYRTHADQFARTKAEIEVNTRFSAEGRKAELAEYALRALNELGRTDAVLEQAQAKLDELTADARKVPLDVLTPAQLGLVPAVHAWLREIDPLELPTVLEEAVADRDVVALAAFLAGPTTKALRLAVSDEQLDAAREAAAGPLPAGKRKVLARLRELVGAAQTMRKALVRDLKQAAGLEQDALAAMLGVEPGKPQDDPIARMALGLSAKDEGKDEPAQAA